MDLANFQGLHRANGMAAGPNGNAFSNGIGDLEMFGQKGRQDGPFNSRNDNGGRRDAGNSAAAFGNPQRNGCRNALRKHGRRKNGIGPKKMAKGNGRGNADKAAKSAADEDGQEMFMQNGFLPVDRKGKHSRSRP